MTSRKMTPLLLAASIFLTGAAGAFLGAATPSFAITSVDELSDVDQDHWAFEALRDLVEKYDVIEGYPDGTFRGNRTPTRWEMAAALNALIKSVGRDIARLGAEKADKTDLQTLARLQEQFRNELAALQARTSALESRASAIEAKNEEQDNRLTLLEKTQIHGDASFGILSDIGSQGVVGGNGSQKDGIRDAMSTIGRLRLTLDVPLREDQEDSKIGRTDLHTRLIAAFGRISPSGAQGGGLAGTIGGISGYSRIAGDASANNEGLTNGSLNSNSQLRSSVYVENMHVKQHFKDGIPLLTDWFITPDSDNWETSGDLYVGQVPWRYLFDKSPYRGNENSQFQNTLFVNVPAAVNYNMPMVAYAWHQKLGSDDLTADFTTGAATLDTGDAMSAFNLTYEGRLNYKLFNLPGNVYAGGYHMWSNGANGATINGATSQQGITLTQNQLGGSTTTAYYAGWNQEWYKGIGTTINYLNSGPGRNNLLYTSTNPINGASVNNGGSLTGRMVSIRQAITGVLSIPMAAVAPGWRDNDTFGVGYGIIDIRDNYKQEGIASRFKSANEGVVETYYKWQATEAISVVPSVQLIFNRYWLKQNGTTAVLGLRTSFTF
jgi:hypothetical protein